MGLWQRGRMDVDRVVLRYLASHFATASADAVNLDHLCRNTRLVADAAREVDPDQKSKLATTASWLGGAGRSIAVDVMTRSIEHQTGLG